jgi:hypothetical protein
MTREQWFAAARAAAIHYWEYEALVDDAQADLEACFERGDDPRESIKSIGIDLDLFEFGKAFGSW